MMQYNGAGIEHRKPVEHKHMPDVKVIRFRDYIKFLIIVLLFVAIVLYIANMK